MVGGPLAQLVEQRTFNPRVVGSSPTGPTHFATRASEVARGLSQPRPIWVSVDRVTRVDLTNSFETAVPADVLARYTWLETRKAAAVLGASNPEEFDDLLNVLREFWVYDSDILVAGGNRGQIPIRLDSAFERRGWSAVRINTTFSLHGVKKSKATARGYDDKFLSSTVENDGFEVDNFKSRVAVDVEWNAKDGNLDRDLSAYRALYEVGLIDCAVIITRDHEGIRRLAGEDLESEDAHRRLGTTTTTNMAKLGSRMTRGDSGGCPVLAVGITRATWAGRGVPGPVPLPDVDGQDAAMDFDRAELDDPPHGDSLLSDG